MKNSRAQSRQSSVEPNFMNRKPCHISSFYIDNQVSQTNLNTHRVNVTPRLVNLQQKRELFINKKLPQIKALRLNKALNWRKKKNKNLGGASANMNYYSTQDLNVKNSMF